MEGKQRGINTEVGEAHGTGSTWEIHEEVKERPDESHK